jgi:peptide chain release factor subunit 1
LKEGNADTVIISEDINTLRLEAVCKNCGYTDERFVNSTDLYKEKATMSQQVCPVCGKSLWSTNVQDVVDYVSDLANQVGAKVEVVSSRSEAGVMFKNFGGIAVILRYQKK